jgi:hypothetical protein
MYWRAYQLSWLRFGASSRISALGNSLFRSYYRTTVKATTRVETLSRGNGRLEPVKFFLKQGTNLRQSERRWRITLWYGIEIVYSTDSRELGYLNVFAGTLSHENNRAVKTRGNSCERMCPKEQIFCTARKGLLVCPRIDWFKIE